MIEDRELRGDLGPDGALSIPYVTVIDLHAGDLPEALEPFVFYDASPVERQARALALGYGLGHLVRQPSDGRTVAAAPRPPPPISASRRSRPSRGNAACSPPAPQPRSSPPPPVCRCSSPPARL
jgi:hypothetical protein